ncbi:hypothetical protein ACGFIF_34995 [Kribbella sp. NPDC049174]|uniref:hypothetical protein n=1 Tax=Kribbella sp. NPDC049174 TaxID=3364112 RepID=UPI00371AB9E3
MADDDEQTVALEPDQHEQGDDDSPEALSERRGAGKWVRDAERPAASLTPEEARREEEELEQVHEEEIELAAKDERELIETRRRRELVATKETTEALRLADVAETQRDRRRDDAAAERRQGRSDRAHGRHLLDEAAARPDEPGADATAAAGRRYQRAAEREDRAARYDERAADRYDAEARDRRSEAAQQPGQPPAEEAVRNPPTETPTARKFDRKLVRKQRKTQPGELSDIGLGD